MRNGLCLFRVRGCGGFFPVASFACGFIFDCGWCVGRAWVRCAVAVPQAVGATCDPVSPLFLLVFVWMLVLFEELWGSRRLLVVLGLVVGGWLGGFLIVLFLLAAFGSCFCCGCCCGDPCGYSCGWGVFGVENGSCIFLVFGVGSLQLWFLEVVFGAVGIPSCPSATPRFLVFLFLLCFPLLGVRLLRFLVYFPVAGWY